MTRHLVKHNCAGLSLRHERLYDGSVTYIQGYITLAFISSIQASKRHLSQSLWRLRGEIEDLSVIRYSFRDLCPSNKYEYNTFWYVTY